jgi:hypothetical protein
MQLKNGELKNVLASDPGLHTGISWFPDDVIIPQTFDFRARWNAKTTSEKLDSLVSQLDLYNFRQYRIEHVVIEGVEIYSGSLKSMTAATRGDLSLLAYIVGAYYHYFHGLPTEIISPQWKGQLTYTALDEWVYRINGQHYKSEHIRAAVGLGLWKKGILK